MSDPIGTGPLRHRLGRRRFLAALAGGLLAAPLAAFPQLAGKLYRVGLIFSSSDPASQVVSVFRDALRDLGYVEGQNPVLARRSLEGRADRASEVVAELVRLKVDVIVTANNPATRAAKEATTSIPIVMAANGTPVEQGLVASLAPWR